MDIEKLYKSNPKIKKSDVEILENWVETQPHLPKTDEKMLIILLNACELNLERTKKCIECYYTVRASFPAMFDERDPELPMNLQGLNVFVYEPFKKLSPQGHGIFYIAIINPDVAAYDFCTAIKLIDMRLHAWLHTVGCVNGIEIVFNMKGATWRHWQKMGIMDIRKGFSYLLEGFPVCLKAVHFINPVPFLNAILAILYPFISNDIKQIVNIYDDVNSLFDVLPTYCIPDELNGTGGSTEQLHRNYIETIKMNREYFIDNEQYKSDESKRVRVGYLKRLGF